MSESKALTKAEETKALAALSKEFEGMGGAGTEDADRDSYAIPFLQILQSGSPQVKKTSGSAIEGAEEGMLINTVDNTLYSVEKDGIPFVPCYFRRAFVEWVPRNDGGGYVGEYAPGSEPKTERDEENRDVIVGAGEGHDGNELYDTRYHYGILLTDEGPRPMVIAMTRTQVKKSRRWLYVISEQRWPDGVSRNSTPPSFLYQYRLSVVAEHNDDNSWWNWDISKIGPVTDASVVHQAKAFYEAIKGGEVREATESVAGDTPDPAAAASTEERSF